jgi:hypothetical protein
VSNLTLSASFTVGSASNYSTLSNLTVDSTFNCQGNDCQLTNINHKHSSGTGSHGLGGNRNHYTNIRGSIVSVSGDDNVIQGLEATQFRILSAVDNLALSNAVILSATNFAVSGAITNSHFTNVDWSVVGTVNWAAAASASNTLNECTFSRLTLGTSNADFHFNDCTFGVNVGHSSRAVPSPVM